MPSKDKYTDPELREEVKEELKESDKGGAPGQWSARKAQMMASEYKKRGGGYTTDKETGQDESLKNLQKWGEEDWQTKDGDGEAKEEDGSRKRYLPKKAWDNMDEHEKEETDEKKQKASKKGQQHVANTEKAKESRKKANEEEAEQFEERKGQNKSKSNGTNNFQSSKSANKEEEADDEVNGEREQLDEEKPEEDESEEEYEEEATEDDEDDMEVDNKSQGRGEPKQTAGKKRGRKANNEAGSSKSQKANSGQGNSKGTIGSKHDSADEPAQQGSADRLPKEGDHVSWKAMPGWVHGELVEIVTSKKKVEGKDVKGSEKDPRFVLRADSGKICVHKPEACYYD